MCKCPICTVEQVWAKGSVYWKVKFLVKNVDIYKYISSKQKILSRKILITGVGTRAMETFILLFDFAL